MSMSACLNNLFFSPSIISVSEEELADRLVGPPPPEGYHSATIINVSGHIVGLKCNAPAVAEEWEKGSKPKLIDS